MTNQIEKCLTKISNFFGNKAVNMEAAVNFNNHFLAGKCAPCYYRHDRKISTGLAQRK
jgi:biotin synthase-like enzyme